MKRPVLSAVFLLAVVGLAGCPIYDHQDDGCYRDSDCGRDYVCNRDSGDCVLPSNGNCSKPSDCDRTSTCTPARLCSPGDCSFSGCVAGYQCDSSTGVWQCIANGSGSAGTSGDAGAAGQAAIPGAGGAAGQGGQSAAGASGSLDVSTGGVGG